MKDYTKEFNPSPEQRSLTIKGKEACDLDNKYCKINNDAMSAAMRDLKPNTFKLWLYFAKNQNKYTFWLSAVDVHNFTGMSRSTYHRAFDELVDKFYLIRDPEDTRHYDFYERPHDTGIRDCNITINK